MSTKKGNQDPLEEEVKHLNEGFEKLEYQFEEHKSKILTFLTVLIVLVLAYVGYNKLIKEPKELEASASIFKAQQYFEKDSFKLALNGDGANLGFEAIMDEFGSTKTAKIAKYQAGICQLKLGKYQEAIDYLEDYSCPDKLIQTIANGGTGDAYMELGKIEDGIANYEKAVKNAAGNEILEPIYLSRLAVAALVNKKEDIAKSNFKLLVEKYPDTNEGNDAVKYLLTLGE